MKRLPLRARVAVSLGGAAGQVSRLAGRGDGSVIGGVLGLKLEPGLLRLLAAGRQVVLVTGTNGKTTTTRLVAAALEALSPDIATNAFGANMDAGHVSALGRSPHAPFGVLETDERYLASTIEATRPGVVVLLNLSRDQMDRAAEIWLTARRWRRALAAAADCVVVANADEPLIAWAASAAPRVVWVAAGQRWHEDSWCCPECGSHLRRDEAGWGCAECGFARPAPSWVLAGDTVTGDTVTGGTVAGATVAGGTVAGGTVAGGTVAGGTVAGGTVTGDTVTGGTVAGHTVTDDVGQTRELALTLPGRANASNAVMALAAAAQFGARPDQALPLVRQVRSVAGRYTLVERRGRRVRLLLAKNPAGWLEAFDVLAPKPGPVLLAVNARGPDGRDTSWLWDVDYRVLAGRPVYVAGERGTDLAVRLEADGVPFELVAGVDAAVGRVEGPELDVLANYTAFQQIRALLGRAV